MRLVRAAFLSLLPIALAGIGVPAEARITKIEINSRAVAYGGTVFGAVGQYETLRGVAFGEVDPNDSLNEVITDIKLAPRNARGMVEYNMDFWISKPVDMTKANGTLLHDVPNRGRVRTLEINVGGLATATPATASCSARAISSRTTVGGATSPQGCRSGCPWRETRTAARSPAACARNTSSVRRRARRT